MRSDLPNPAPVPTYADRPVTKVPNWHGLVVLDLLFNNLTTGLFLCAAVSELLAPAAFGAVARVAYPLAMALLIADLVCLVLDLGDPLRFHHMLRVWKPSSPMSLGTWSLVAYSVPLTVLTALSLWPAPAQAEALRRIVLLVGLLPAFGASLYKGVLFSTTAQPGWREARWLGGYLVNSAFLLGAGLMLSLAVLLDQPQASRVLRPALIALVPIHLAALGLLLSGIGPRLAEVRSGRQRASLGAVVVVGGMLAPMLLLVLDSHVAHLIAVALLLTSAVVARAELVFLPHRRPLAGIR